MTYKILKYTLNKKAQRSMSDITNDKWKTLKIPPRSTSAYRAGYNLGSAVGSKLSKYPRLFDAVKRVINKIPGL
jgi:hypothetical protein